MCANPFLFLAKVMTSLQSLYRNFSFSTAVTLEETALCAQRQVERSRPLPARLCAPEKETLFVSCWIWGFICNLENPTPHSAPFCYPTRGCSLKGSKGSQCSEGENTAWLTLVAQTFERSPHSETHLLLPPVFSQFEENVFKQSAVIMGLGSRVRNPGFECILAI